VPTIDDLATRLIQELAEAAKVALVGDVGVAFRVLHAVGELVKVPDQGSDELPLDRRINEDVVDAEAYLL
jgi:hypothetical protein